MNLGVRTRSSFDLALRCGAIVSTCSLAALAVLFISNRKPVIVIDDFSVVERVLDQDAQLDSPVRYAPQGIVEFLSTCGVDRRFAAEIVKENLSLKSIDSWSFDTVFDTVSGTGANVSYCDFGPDLRSSYAGRFCLAFPENCRSFVLLRIPPSDEQMLYASIDGEEEERIDYNELLDRFSFQHALVPSEEDREPHLWLAGGRIDIGDIRSSSPTIFEARLFNVGDRSLPIQRVGTSCGCVSVEQYPDSIRPSGVGTFVCRVLPKQSAGEREFQQRLQIWTDDQQSPSYTIPITGRYRSSILVEPRIVYIGDLAPETERREFDITVFSPTPESTRIKTRIADAGLLVGAAVSSGTFSKRLPFTLDCSEVPVAADGSFMRAAILDLEATSDSGEAVKETAAIQAYGRMLPWMEAAPKSVFLGRVEPDTEITRRIRLVCRASEFKHLSVDDEQRVIVRLEDSEVISQITTPHQSGHFSFQIRVSAGEHSLLIPIRGYVVGETDDADDKG